MLNLVIRALYLIGAFAHICICSTLGVQKHNQRPLLSNKNVEGQRESAEDEYLRYRHRKTPQRGAGSKGVKKLHLAQEILDASHSNYGINLPAFSFDYSEYIAGAVIERSSYSDNLYLSMFFVGHGSVAHDWPFDALSTEEEVLYSWGRAARLWNHTSTRAHHRFSKESRSGIMCVMHGVGVHKTHMVPAHWVAHSDAETDSSTKPIRGIFEILRCPIRGSNRVIYESLSQSSEALFVDLVRLKDRRDPMTPSAAGTLLRKGFDVKATNLKAPQVTRIADEKILHDTHHDFGENQRRLHTEESANTDDRTAAMQQSRDQAHTDRVTSHQNVLISFSVSWKARQAGFGVNYHLQSHAGAGQYDLWRPTALIQRKNQSDYILVNGVTNPTGDKNENASFNNKKRSETIASASYVRPRSGLSICVPGARPLHPHRAEVGLPMLLEFVEHHVNLGVDHIFLGVALDWHSPLMRKYFILLQSYVDAGLVSISSMALNGFDDAMGFSGMHINDNYADLFFVNQCLYLNKGIADYVSLLKPSQFLVLPFGVLTLDKALINLANSTLQNVSSTSQCSFPLETYQVPDPPGTFGGWGPADSVFSADFFGVSKSYGPLDRLEEDIPVGDQSSSHILSTRHTWLAGSRSGLLCGNSHSYIPSYLYSAHARRRGNKIGTGVKETSNSGANTNVGGRLQVYHFVEKVTRIPRLQMEESTVLTPKQTVDVQFITDASPVLAVLREAWLRLRTKGLGALDAINYYIIKKQESIPAPTGPAPVSATSMRKPFWLPTNTAHLLDALRAVLPIAAQH